MKPILFGIKSSAWQRHPIENVRIPCDGMRVWVNHYWILDDTGGVYGKDVPLHFKEKELAESTIASSELADMGLRIEKIEVGYV